MEFEIVKELAWQPALVGRVVESQHGRRVQEEAKRPVKGIEIDSRQSGLPVVEV